MHSFTPDDFQEPSPSPPPPDTPPPPSSPPSTALSDYISHLTAHYTVLVRKDPASYRALESLLCSLSYLCSGRFSQEVSELVFMCGNLLRYAHDRILAIRERREVPPEHADAEVDKDRLERMLQILQCIEVFIELSARRLGGSRLKWVAVLAVTSIKLTIRICLIYQHNRVLISTSSLSDVPRGWVGARTGLFVRQTHPSTYIPHHIPNKELLFAEICYTLKPIAHLIALGVFRSKSWVPFLLSLGMDVYSLQRLAGGVDHPTERQEMELGRRKVAMGLYLLRSPFYEAFSEERLGRMVGAVNSVPILGLLTDGVTEYLPDWRGLYSYLWGS